MEFDLESLAVFKLVNGEVIICEIATEDELQVTVRYAIRAVEMFMGDEFEVRFTQWIPFTEDLIVISRHGIIAFAPPSDDMKQMYLNRMAELDAEPPQQDVEIPPFRRSCHNHAFQRKQ
jgi:hypothetical protein